MTTVSVDADALDSAGQQISTIATDLDRLRAALRSPGGSLAHPLEAALESFARNSGELLTELTKHASTTATSLTEAAQCYRSAEESIVAAWQPNAKG